MKVWQRVILIGAVLFLCGLVFILHTVNKLSKGIVEAFQAAAPEEPETTLEREAYDIYEAENTTSLEGPPPTTMEQYDSAGALAEFDDDVPAPWDFDNKILDPKDVMWGVIDSRCSMELRERAKLRALFSTANNVEIQPNGEVGYYSTKLNGMIVYDPVAIIGVKYFEFAVDTALEEIIEGRLSKLGNWMMGKEGVILSNASEQAREDLSAEMKTRKAAGNPMTKAEQRAFYTQRQGANIKVLQAAESAKGTLQSGRLSTALKPAKEAVREAGSMLKASLRRATTPAIKLAKSGLQKLTPALLRSLGQKAAQKILVSLAARRLAIMAAVQAARRAAMTAVYSIPIYGQIIAAVDLFFNLMFLVVIPQILADYTDLDEDPMSSSCNPGAFQGCPDSHPFNIRCATIAATGGPLVWDIITSVPTIGDALGTFAPYLCTNEKLQSVFRQSFRPPPYYFDSTLSIFFAKKPNVMSGNPEGDGADQMYYTPGYFRLHPDEVDSVYHIPELIKRLPDGKVGNSSTSWGTPYHPWVDFSHTEMLDKMAEFYYEQAVKFADIDLDGFATFQYIDQFKGLIASSQYSCDVQVTLKEIKYKPFTGEIAAGYPRSVVNPWQSAESIDTGCSYHDRRFYFTWDFLKAIPGENYANSTPEQITNTVNRVLLNYSIDQRLAAFRRMCVPTGCTHENGTAPDVVDTTPDGEPIADAPVSLGLQGQGYLPPVVSATDVVTIPKEESCGAFRSKLNHYGTRYTRPNSDTDKSQGKLDSPPTGERVIFQSPDDYTPNLLDTTPTRRRMVILNNVVTQTSLTVATVSQLQAMTGTQGDLIFVTGESKDYIFWNGSWVVYNPKPTWRNRTDVKNSTLEWLQGTTKMWQEKSVDRSTKERWFAGIQGGLTAYLPLKFGIQGGFIATTMDAGGLGGALACVYTDGLNQQGNYVLNGMTVTSQQKFVINRGPIILYAPGYTPRITNPCANFKVSQTVCSNRLAIRRMARLTNASLQSESRRVKFLLSSRPDQAAGRCVYEVNTVEVRADGSELPNTAKNESVAVPYSVPSGSTTCTMLPGAVDRLGTGGVDIAPLTTTSSDLNPPLNSVLYGLISTTDTKFKRADSCLADTATCEGAKVKEDLRQQFNARFAQKSVEIIAGGLTGGKTPTPDEIGKVKPTLTGQRTCVYRATVNVAKGDGTPQVTQEQNYITMVVAPRPGSTCEYDLVSHDYPLRYFPAPVPKSGLFELPVPALTKRGGLLLRAGCDEKYKDCSGAELIDRLVSQFNLAYTDRKILRVVKAFTPVTDAKNVCDYEVDIQRVTGGKAYMERDTLRFTMQQVADTAGAIRCLWDRTSDTSNGRQTGPTIQTNSSAQALSTEYIWPLNYMASIRKQLNTFIGTIINQDLPGTIDKAATETKMKLDTLSRTINATMQTIQGCPSNAANRTCKDQATLQSFMNRYNFDNSPPYPSGQFGSTVRSIVGWRRAGLAGPRECHLELIEREDFSPNWVIKRKDGVGAETARFYLRQYSFGIDNASGNPCVITPRPFTREQLDKRTFDISGGAYGITEASSVVTADLKFTTAQINPTSVAVLNAMKLAADAYKPRKDDYVSQTVTEINAVLMARPNVVEYKVKLSERMNDPDFGTVTNRGIVGIVRAEWNEAKWNPVTGQFVGAGVPAPDVLVFVPGRATLYANQKVKFDGDDYDYPPYLYWPVPDIDPTTQESRIQEITLIWKTGNTWAQKVDTREVAWTA